MVESLKSTGWSGRGWMARLGIAVLGVGLSVGPMSAAVGMDEEEIVVVQAGRIITVSGDEIERGEIVIIDGKISLVGRNLEYPANAKVIDASSETVIPGMVNAMSRFGLPNRSRSGVNGDVIASEDVVFDDLELDAMLRAGFTGVAFIPPGSGIPGRASVYRTTGDEAHRVIDEESYLLVSMWNAGGDKPALRNALNKAQSEIDKVEKARKEWDEKQAKAKADAEAKKKAEEDAKKKEGEGSAPRQDDPPKDGEKQEEAKEEKFEAPKIDAAYQPLVDLLQKKAGVWALVRLSGADTVVHMQDLLSEKDGWDELDFRYYIPVSSGSDLHYVLDRIGELDSIVLTNPVLGNKPATVMRTNLVAEMAYAGADVAMTPSNDSTFSFSKYFGDMADVVRSGWTREAMLKAAILKPWELLDLGGQFGTIEKDKWGDLVFLDGDLLNPATRVKRIMIAGEIAWEDELLEGMDR